MLFYFTFEFSPVENVPMRDCSELYQLGYKAPGVYWIDPTGKVGYDRMVKVFCEDGWTHILRRDSRKADDTVMTLFYAQIICFAVEEAMSFRRRLTRSKLEITTVALAMLRRSSGWAAK